MAANETCPECVCIGKVSTQNCAKCGGTGEVKSISTSIRTVIPSMTIRIPIQNIIPEDKNILHEHEH